MIASVPRTSAWSFVFAVLWFSMDGSATVLAAGASPSVNQVSDARNAGDERAAAARTARAYFAALESGDYDRAYAFLHDNLRLSTSLADFRRDKMSFNAEAGRVKRRVLTRTTVYRDPPQASPGLYVALDFTNHFANADRHCGYIVLLKRPSGDFAIIREEENYMTRATEAAIEQKHSRDEVERVWRQLSSAACPGYKGRSI